MTVSCMILVRHSACHCTAYWLHQITFLYIRSQDNKYGLLHWRMIPSPDWIILRDIALLQAQWGYIALHDRTLELMRFCWIAFHMFPWSYMRPSKFDLDWNIWGFLNSIEIKPHCTLPRTSDYTWPSGDTVVSWAFVFCLPEGDIYGLLIWF